MPSLNSVSQRSFEQYDRIKPEELAGQTCHIENVRGPYDSEFGEFIVVQVVLDGDEPRDLMLSYIANSQRDDLLGYFAVPGQEPIGPVVLVKRDIGENRSFWAFKDADEE